MQTKMSDIKRAKYTVCLSDGTEHDVTITHQDMLRAEQMGVRLGLPNMTEAPMTATTLWCWAALKRTGVLDVKPQTFLNETCEGVQKQKGDDGEDVEVVEDVDPTRFTPDIGSASDSQPTTPAPSSSGSPVLTTHS